MNFSASHAVVFWLFIPLAFALTHVILKYRKLKKVLSEKNRVSRGHFLSDRMEHCFWFRTIFRALSASMVILAGAGISWGTDTIPVQKNGKAVSFVFDISYSMEAHDAPGGISRLSAASIYAKGLLEHFGGTKVSVVLAKGDGTVAVPLTDDYNCVETLMDNLSPKLMTAEGTSLGKGIKAAVSSFPEQSSEASYILLFTDCEETDNTLQSSLAESARFGIPVIVVGFGSERESEVLTGDGQTKVKTALRTSEIERIIKSIKNAGSISSCEYIDASEMGSATKILKIISAGSNGNAVSYEIQRKERHKMFIILAIVFFLASILLGELDVTGGRNRLLSGAAMTACIFFFTGCTPKFDDGVKILQGKLDWGKGNYQNATASFLQAASNAKLRGDDFVYQYSVYGIGSTYLMQGENDAALAKFNLVFEDAPDQIKFAILYNSGIIAHRSGDYETAANFFRQSLFIDGTSTDAKINLELSLREESSHSNESAREIVPVSENNEDQTLENALYSIIKEGEQQQWKSQQKDSERTSQDY
ncbi:VWA domain-containing protein [Treponema sp.]|uniref:VWA domain-containing protein n=1 Tax=Treponema sp. TaxID=166 RepID=UPI00298EC20F|nr:VWA domain-containing protein [Treponema sp.]MCQ2241894.1 VWA domain-containing protein [Treponema sp.]